MSLIDDFMQAFLRSEDNAANTPADALKNLSGAQKPNEKGKHAENGGKIVMIKGNPVNDWNIYIDMLLYPGSYVYEDDTPIDPREVFKELTLLESSGITVPNKMDLYEGLDITEKDRLFVELDTLRYDRSVLLVNGEDRVVGLFSWEYVRINNEERCILVANADNLDFRNHQSTKYFFLFCHPPLKIYKVPIEVSFQKLETTNTHLCIDFGTSNTTAGCFLDERYVNNVSNIAVINGNVKLNEENVVTFIDRDRSSSADKIDTLCLQNLTPTIVYVKDCSDSENIDYLFGHQAARWIKDDKYCPKASCFMEIKRWTSNINVNEEIQDRSGNRASVPRREIISQYLMFVIRNAENQFKCKFRNIHISAPVKLKDKVLSFYADILAEHGYVLEQEHAIDEGIAVLYSIISNQIRENNYENNKEKRALIIDCGGGTSDLASCRYTIEKDEDDIINLNIVTEYMNGDVNFGGNNLTYRIMQYMKVAYAYKLAKKDRVIIDNIIQKDTSELFSYIEGELENDASEKVRSRYEEVYQTLNEEYAWAESIIPTRFKEYENRPPEIYNNVKNNFYFLWKLAEEMKKEFYRSTSISRYTFNQSTNETKEVDLHINRIEDWRLSVMKGDVLKPQDYPDITFTAKEIDKLLRADIYYLVRKFLNDLYMKNELSHYSQIKLSGQSSKINIFMESLKEFLPGKMIKSGSLRAGGDDAEERKLLCLKGAMMYLHALEKSNIEVNLHSETQNIPISVYIKNEGSGDKLMFSQGSDWNQPAARRRITTAGKEVYLHMRNADREIGEPYKYVYENMQYTKTTFAELQKLSGGRITQELTDQLTGEKKYIFVFLNKEDWGFNILPVYGDANKVLYKGRLQFCPFEMDILQETFFDGRK